jgi:RNA polymerase sigma-70 factor (ECF subfamily)
LPVADVLRGLPPALKAVAALALSGHSRREIGYLLRLPDTALRQRLSALRRKLMARGLALPATTPGLSLDLSYGRIRDALLPQLLREGGLFASHDPDGHLFIIRRSQTGASRQQGHIQSRT